MPNNKLHKKLWQIAFGNCDFPFVPVDKQMDEYSQKLPGIKHRLKDHDPLKTGDYEDPEPENDKWRIVYRFYHIAVDCWWTKLSKEGQKNCSIKIKKGKYPSEVDTCFWKIIDAIVVNPLGIYEILPWKCEPLPIEWEKYIKGDMQNNPEKMGVKVNLNKTRKMKTSKSQRIRTPD